MVEEMSLDEGRDASDGPLCGGRSDLVVEFNSDYERSPSESSGYETDPNLYNDVPVITEVDWNAGLPEDDIYMPDIQEDQLQNLETVDIVSWLYS